MASKLMMHSTDGLVHYEHPYGGLWCRRWYMRALNPRVACVTCLWCLAGVAYGLR